MVQYHTQIHPDKILGCKKLIFFDIIEKNVILCVLEMSALGTLGTLMTVSLKVTKLLGKFFQFEFLVMTEKNILAYKLLSLNILKQP